MTENNASSSDQKTHKREATLTSEVTEWLGRQRDLFYWKASDRYTPGISDIIACVRGIFVGLELKAEYNDPTPAQRIFIRLIRASGGVAGVVYSLGDAKRLIEEARQCAPIAKKE